jgi:HAE1 family hydrophobic/amphiphilic exporter-1
VLAKFFIERPVLANVIALVTMLLGGVAMFNLPVAQYPPITPPTIQVTANYPGANAKTLVETVALPIEQQVNGVENMLYMQSTCTSDGRYTLTVTFKVGTDLDFAQVLVQNRVSAALAQLPQSVQQQGVVTKKKSTAILQIITLTSPTDQYDALFLSNFATLQLRDKLARVAGVSDVTVFGIGQYSMRVWLDPQQMLQRSLMPGDVIAAIQQQNTRVAAGQIGMPPTPPGGDFQLTIDVEGDLSNVAEFEQIIVKFDPDNGGQITRLRDIGRVELGAQTYSQFFKVDDKVAGGIAIYQLPDANALDTAKRVRAAMAELAKDFPKGLVYTIPFDTTVFVNASVNEVYHTLFEAGVLVLCVIIVFLQDWRATLVPATTVPVTIIGAFAAMSVMGFSINLLTLFAVVLAIGIVVDDAIVVVEGTAQHLERGKTPKQASIDAMRELIGPILGVTLVLMSVFVPPAFIPGITGQMYRQFALVIAATALISAVNAATLKPTQCALWLRQPDRNRRRNIFFRGFNAVYERVEKFYVRQIRRMVQRSGQMAVIALVLIALAGWGLTRVPTGFIPTEDQGYAMVTVQLPDGASLERTEQVMNRLARTCKEHPAVERAIAIGGLSPLDGNASLANAGIIYLMFKDWSKRGKGEDLRSIYNVLSARLANFQEAKTMVLVPPPIQGLGLSGGFQMQVELTDGSYDFPRLQAAADEITAQAKASPVIRMALTPLRASVPQISIDVNRTQTESMGVDVGDVYNTVQTYLGSSYVNLFTKFGHNYMVYAQADARYRLESDSLKSYYVRGQSGQMIPLSTVAGIEPTQGPSVITLYNLFPSATINGAAKDAFSSGQALATMEGIANKVLPAGMSYEWTAMSYQEKLVGSSTYFIFALAILLVYFVLAGQYESWITPAAVILAVPLALLGTVGALLALGVANNLYVQIGLVLLIALSAKNAILIVEMAREGRAAGKSIIDATVEASQVRFRPILMTSFTFILGVLPLVLASGAGASARKSLGLAVATGMLASTCLAVLFVPAFYVVLQRWMERKRPKQAVSSLATTGLGPVS